MISLFLRTSGRSVQSAEAPDLASPAPQVQTTADPYASPFSLQIAADSHLNSTPTNYTGYQLLGDALRDSGAGWTRMNVRWETIQPSAPQPGQSPVYRWDYYDQKLGLAAAAGTQIIFTLAYVPLWASTVTDSSYPCKPIKTDQLPVFAEFLKAAVAHYRQAPYNVTHWEVFNEPDYTLDNGWSGGLGCWGNYPTEYAQMLSVASAAIKEADPNAVVMMGGVLHDWFDQDGTLTGPFSRYFLDSVFAAGAGDVVDTMTFHYFPFYRNEWNRWDPDSTERKSGTLSAPRCGDVYTGPGPAFETSGFDVEAKTNYIRNRLQACFGVNKPIWITELAEHGYEGNARSLERQARYVVKGHARALGAGVTNITWYALTTPTDGYQMSLLTSANWLPKPAFRSYQTLTHELTGFRFVRTLDILSGEGYAFQNAAGIEKIVAWGTNTRVTLTALRVRVLDHQGVESWIEDGSANDLDQRVNGIVVVGLNDPWLQGQVVDIGDPGTPYFLQPMQDYATTQSRWFAPFIAD